MYPKMRLFHHMRQLMFPKMRLFHPNYLFPLLLNQSLCQVQMWYRFRIAEVMVQCLHRLHIRQSQLLLLLQHQPCRHKVDGWIGAQEYGTVWLL